MAEVLTALLKLHRRFGGSGREEDGSCIESVTLTSFGSSVDKQNGRLILTSLCSLLSLTRRSVFPLISTEALSVSQRLPDSTLI